MKVNKIAWKIKHVLKTEGSITLKEKTDSLKETRSDGDTNTPDFFYLFIFTRKLQL